ncbi:MAG: hypothetical protein WD314_07040, partial [Trueperaceae bacterium]
ASVPSETESGGGVAGAAVPSDTVPSDTVPSDTVPSDTGAEALERLEFERLGVETRLGDPLLLGEREKGRLERHLAALIDELSLRYDRRLPPPLPTYSVREAGVRLSADRRDDGLSFTSAAPAELRLLMQGAVAHLTLREREGHRLLPWARAALLDAATRLAFYVLAPKAVQHYSRETLPVRLLRPLDGGWWSLTRELFERLEGWQDGDSVPVMRGERRPSRNQARNSVTRGRS